MNSLTKNDLEKFLENNISLIPNISPQARVYGIAMETLIHLIGKEWIAKNLFTVTPTNNFLRVNTKTREDGFKLQDRVIELAEMLFNFQNVSGLENLVKALLKDGIESHVAELQSARLLYNNGTHFSFVTPSGKKGKDYDAIVIFSNIEIACEFKCKIEVTHFRENTIKETLKKAKDQLPKDKTGLIFIKIPEVWTTQENVAEKFYGVFFEFFRRTTRVNSIVVHWEEWSYFTNGQALRMVRFDERVNPNSKISLGKILKEIEPNSNTFNWFYFDDLVKKKFGVSNVERPKPIKCFLLGNGFSWHAVIQILPQIKNGEHVIYELGDPRHACLTLLVDHQNYLIFRIIDANLNRFELKTNKPFSEIGLRDFVYLRLQITPVFSFSELSIAINNINICKKGVTLNQNSIVLPNTALGGDLNGQRKTAMSLAELATYDRATNTEENKGMTEYFNIKFALF